MAHSVEKDPLENTVKLRESQDCNHKVISTIHTICCITLNTQLLADIRATEALRLGAGTGQTVAWHWLQQGGATAAPGIAAQSTEVEAAAYTQIQGHGVLVKLTHANTPTHKHTHIHTYGTARWYCDCWCVIWPTMSSSSSAWQTVIPCDELPKWLSRWCTARRA